MRGFLQPSHRHDPNETQNAFWSLSRNRRSKLAEAAQTDLVKAAQWARGETVPASVASALEKTVSEHLAKKKG